MSLTEVLVALFFLALVVAVIAGGVYLGIRLARRR